MEDDVEIDFTNPNGGNIASFMYCTPGAGTIYVEFIPRHCTTNTYVGWGTIFTIGTNDIMNKTGSSCWRYTARRVYGSSGGAIDFQGFHWW